MVAVQVDADTPAGDDTVGPAAPMEESVVLPRVAGARAYSPRGNPRLSHSLTVSDVHKTSHPVSSSSADWSSWVYAALAICGTATADHHQANSVRR
jgi:hypothetical protein